MGCIPLDITNRIASKYVDCWKTVQSFVDWKKSGEITWDDRCYLPISACIAIASNGVKDVGGLNMETIQDAVTIAAVAPWRLYKQTYSFQEDMEKLLFEQADDLVIPIEILNNLPYPCIYIETHTIEDMEGFFVHFESDAKDGRLELRFLIVEKEFYGGIPIAVHLKPGNTIRDGVNQMYLESKRIRERYDNPMVDKFDLGADCYADFLFKVASRLMQLVLYICAENKEIEEDPVQAKITRTPKSTEFIKDKFREVRKWNCGENTGNIIRGIYGRNNYRSYTKSDTQGQGTSKRPHSRRAHWHHYWKGSIKNTDRRLELKWIAPTFIHEELVNDEIVKVNEVKSQTRKGD